MTAQLMHEADAHGYAFTCVAAGLKIPFRQWIQHTPLLSDGAPARVGILSRLVEDEKASLDVDGFEVHLSHDAASHLQSWELKGLGLPDPAPFHLEITTKGVLTSQNFSVDYRFVYPDSRPAVGTERTGSLIRHGNRRYTLVQPLWGVIQLIDGYKEKPILDMDERFQWWARVQEILPENTELNSFLKTMKIVRAERFTIDFMDNVTFTPRFVTLSGRSDQMDVPTPTPVEAQDLLPPEVQKEFNDHFLKAQSIRARYGFKNRWFIALSSTLEKVLDKVRQMNTLSFNERMQFLHNPRAFLRQAFEGVFDPEILEEIFVETPFFLSERIKFLGQWHPKKGFYIRYEGEEWLPERIQEISIPTPEGLLVVSGDAIPIFKQAVRSALDRGANEINWENRKVTLTDELCRALEEIPTKKIHEEKSDKAVQGPRGPDIKPIIEDNLEKKTFEKGIIAQSRPLKDVPPRLVQGTTLLDHQKQGLEWLKKHWTSGSSGSLLADDMGLGKTLQTLAFLDVLRQNMEIDGGLRQQPFLVVAPTGLLSNWEAEARKHLQAAGWHIPVRAHGSTGNSSCFQSLRQAEQTFKLALWVLTTYETLRDKINYFLSTYWAVVVFDEAQKIKNPLSVVSDMAKSVKAEFTLALTGTPVENSLADLWCIIDTVQPGRFGSLKDFQRKYMPDRFPEEEKLLELKRETERPPSHPLLLRRNKEDHWKEKPRKIEKKIEVIMTDSQAEIYTKWVNKARMSDQSKGLMLSTLQHLKATSLHPTMHPEGMNDEEYIRASAKLQATFQTLDQIQQMQEKVLIFLEYLAVQTILAEIIERRYGCQRVPIISGNISGPKRQQLVDDFQKDRNGFGVMILSPKAGGVGITLTAATHVIHLSRWWNPAVEDQCNDRAYRIGQNRDVTIYYPLAVHPEYGEKHSFDIKLHELLERKRTMSRTLLIPPAYTEQDTEQLYRNAVEF
ncbi:DEAD/DEAH box helicase [Desulfosoma sp.]|uniref:DEAD/DEAH box helicase n=1 Tax=Desulfosoma sp. TaxID=2603217 RepID=UPI0040494C35